MELELLKDILIILSLGFLLVAIVVFIRFFVTIRKTALDVNNMLPKIEEGVDEAKKTIIEVRTSLAPKLENLIATINSNVENTGKKISLTLQDISELAQEGKQSVRVAKESLQSSLENIDNLVYKMEEITSNVEQNTGSVLDIIGRIADPLKNVVKVVSAPISLTKNATSRFTRAIGKAASAFKDKVTVGKDKKEE